MIEVKNLSINLGEFFLKNINLAVNDGEYFVILGPTGAGKTILIECIAGLRRMKQGEIWLNDSNVTGLSPEQRNIGYVPQDYVLFPFLNVVNNITFGLKQAKWPKNKIEERAKDIADLMGISHLLERDTTSLSGGEKQRVALARALAPSPKILLLDEPLSALDMQTSRYLRFELQRIHRELGITTIHITHNQVEAEELADRIAILNAGEINQVGSAEEIFFHPCNAAVMNYLGRPNILDCDECRIIGRGIMEAGCRGLKIIVPHDGKAFKRIIIYPRDVYVSVSEPPGSQVNRFRAVITDVKTSASTVRLRFKAGENMIRSELPRQVFEEMGLSTGMEAFITLSLRRIKIFETGENDFSPVTSDQNDDS
jgi:ABC-type sugar transport system ATPase subunit